MRFKIDENLPPFLADRLVAAGFDAITVAQQALSGIADERLAPICAAEERVLVTLDLDFSDVRRHPPWSGPGFVVLRLEGQDRSDLEAAAELLISTLAVNDPRGALWIVEKTRVRVRDRAAG